MTHAKLNSSQRFNNSLKNELDELRRDGSGGGTSSGSTGGSSRPRPADDLIDDMDLSIPEIDLGTGDDSEEDGNGDSQLEDSGNSGDTEQFNLEQLDDTTRSGKGIVDRIVLNSRLTGGYDFDGRPGDEGVLLVIEPQDNSGTYVASPGELTIAVRDPTKLGEDARVAQWEYSAEESTELLRETLLGKGFHLQLPWPNDMPNQSELVVSTTYRTEQGNRLNTRRTIRIDTGSKSIAEAGRPLQDTAFVPAQHDTGFSQVSGVPSPPKAPVLVPITPGRVSSGQSSWQPNRRANVAQQPRSTPNVSRREPTWRPYR